MQFLLCDTEVAPGIVVVRINAQRLLVVIYGFLILLHIEFHIAQIVVRLSGYAGTLLDIACRFGEILTGSLYQFLSLGRGILKVLHLTQLRQPEVIARGCALRILAQRLLIYAFGLYEFAFGV